MTTFVQLISLNYLENGRFLSFVEDVLKAEVLPFLCKEALTTSTSALQSAIFFDETRFSMKEEHY